MLKLIVSQTNQTHEIPTYSREVAKPIRNESFSAQVHPKGPFLYIMAAQDPSHFLSCELTLEIEASKNDPAAHSVICHFPQICDLELSQFVEEDETLLGILMIHFQMKIFEQLLIFCSSHYAFKLIIYPDETYCEYLGIYREFLTCGAYNLEFDETNDITVPINQQIHADWSDYMNQICLRLRQTLWQNQRKNFAIKNYLKTHPFYNV